MEKKDFLIALLILAIVAVIAFVGNLGLTNVAASPPYTNVKLINANDCSADGNCQTDGLSIGNYDYKEDIIQMGELVPIVLNDVTFEVSLVLVEENRAHAVFDIKIKNSQNQQRVALAPGETFLLDNNTKLEITNLEITRDYEVNFMMNVGSGVKGTEETLASTNWKGEGNAYACIDKFGAIFRSGEPCA